MSLKESGKYDFADKIIINGKLVNVLTKEIYKTQIAIKDGLIFAVDDNLESLKGKNTTIIDAKNCFLTPGFIDTHLHLHHTLLGIGEYCKAAIKRGVTAVGMDFYGEGIVKGIESIRKILDLSKKLPIRILFLLPFAAYMQNKPFNHNGNITMDDLYEMLNWDECFGGMDTYAVEVLDNPEVLKLCQKIQSMGKFVTSHGSELSNMQINDWVYKIKETDDHECVSSEEMLYKLRHGIAVSMRFASGSEDLYNLCKLFKKYENIDKRKIAINTDVCNAADLYDKGYIDTAIKIIIKSGVPVLEAYQMATINAAEILKISSTYGCIAPGRKADILFIKDLEKVLISSVMFNGKLVYDNNSYIIKIPKINYPEDYLNTVIIPPSLAKDKLKIFHGKDKKVKVRVIKVNPHSFITDEIVEELNVEDGIIKCSVEKDILYVSAIERIMGTGKISNAFMNGFSIKKGAIGLTYNSQGENLIVLGTNHDDMIMVIQELAKIGGGCVAVVDGKIESVLELKLFGLESIKDLETVVKESNELLATVKKMGCNLAAPFETLSFTGLPNAIGNLKICPEGLVDVWKAKVVDLVVG
ncbi:MAG: adenine deaminase C-terminal domain-containing protein [Candidatus Humimicrobiaceae bacterium]